MVPRHRAATRLALAGVRQPADSHPAGSRPDPRRPGRPVIRCTALRPPTSGGGGRNKGLLIGAVLVVIALVGAAVFVVLNQGGDDGEQVVLEPIDMVQEDDFAGNLDAGESAGAVFADFTPDEDVPDARTDDVNARLAGRAVVGTEPAVYGGSRDTQVCDVGGSGLVPHRPGQRGQGRGLGRRARRRGGRHRDLRRRR